MQDRRRHDRARAFRAGTIAWLGHASPLHCVVRNLSSDGALLLVDEPARAPCDFDVTVFPEGGIRHARVVWRGETGVGVAFGPAPAEARRGADVVSLAEVRRARSPASDVDRLSERAAAVTRPSRRPRPDRA